MENAQALVGQSANIHQDHRAHPANGLQDQERSAAAEAALAAWGKEHRRSLGDIARELQAMGYTNKPGAPYSASCVKSMVEEPS
jgi:hypothetical protein